MTSQSLPAPALPRRLAAMVYDTLLVLPLIMVCVATGLGIRKLLGSEADSLLPATMVQTIAVLSCIGFFGVFWLKSGQTLGMQAWRLKLVPMPGNELTFGRVVTRCVSALLSAVCLGLGYWWCLFDRRKRCWHDYLSGTELVLMPKKAKKSKPSAVIASVDPSAAPSAVPSAVPSVNNDDRQEKDDSVGDTQQ